MKRISIAILCAALAITMVPPTRGIAADVVRLNAMDLIPKVELSFAPPLGSFTEGSTFQVPILINTRGSSVNGIEIRIAFDASKLTIIQPSNGKSIIGVWVEPPSYDNTRGTASFVGVVPNGITTSSGLIGTITFQAKATGHAVVRFATNSNILLNDGQGSAALTHFGRGEYDIIPKPPQGVVVRSDTHPSQDTWYNNNSPTLLWDREPGVTGFSYTLDDKPNSIPDNTVLTDDTAKPYQNLGDGLWYFHIKAIKNNSWSSTGTYMLRIDTTPPAEFTPRAEYLVAAAVMVERTLVSFVTTDNLSGVDHYEVGVIDPSQPATVSPVFQRTDSPYQVPMSGRQSLRVIVRAVDAAGNTRDASIDVKPPLLITQYITDYAVYILLGILILSLLMLLIHYLFGHKVLAHLRRAFQIVKQEEAEELIHNNVQVLHSQAQGQMSQGQAGDSVKELSTSSSTRPDEIVSK